MADLGRGNAAACARPASVSEVSDAVAKVPSSLVVAVRARPLEAFDDRSALRVTPTSITVSPGKSEHIFHFDYAYDGQSTQEIIYRDLGAPILRKALQGFNATIFAYGQTGSGKSYTMMGLGSDFGIIPRMSEELFFCVDKSLEESPEKKFLLTCSYLEIYNEVLQDLLAPPGSKRGQKEPLEIKEHQTLGVYVKGLLELPVRSRSDLVKLMLEGNMRRSTGETKMNARSSRSHSIYSIRIQQQELVEGTDQKREIWSKINLVDLAGSERVSKTGAEGARLKEGISINQSLSALGGVITALADSAKKGKMQYIPYRNSKLTRVLQESLGGNSLTVMIANVSSAASNLDESYNTLQYADRAKAIQVKATRNEQMSEVGKLRQEVELLRQRLAEQVGVEHTEEEERQLQLYRSQIEEYEIRLQQSFEEKAKACALLEEKVKEQQRQMDLQHHQRRAQSASEGRWLHVFAPSNPIWQQSAFFDTLVNCQSRQKDAEEKLERCNAFVGASFEIFSECVAELEQCGVDERQASIVDLCQTIDLSSTEGGNVLRKLRNNEQAKLQQCRHVLLRWQGLQDHLQESQRLQGACVSSCQEICQVLASWGLSSSEQRIPIAAAEFRQDDAAEADKDVQCAISLVEQRIRELRAQSFPLFRQSCAQLLQVLLRGLRSEATSLSALATLPLDTESARAAQQREDRQREVQDAVPRLQELEENTHGWPDDGLLSVSGEVTKFLKIFERAIGHRLLVQQRRSQVAILQSPLQAITESTGACAASPLSAADQQRKVVEQEELKKELETFRAQHQQMLTVIGCQATTIEQVTAGSGNASAREQCQLQALAEQAKQLSELRGELLAVRSGLQAERRSGPSEHELLMQAELEELRVQQERQSQLSEKLLDGRVQQERNLRERTDSTERHNFELQRQVSDLQEHIATLQQQVEQQSEEVAQAQALEQQFAKLAAEMGCVDAQGRLMRQQLEKVTIELIQAKESEAEYYAWLQDVKCMMAAGREDGLAMALAENMEECRRKDKIIRQKEELIRQLRAEKGQLRASRPPSARSELALGPGRGMAPATMSVTPVAFESFEQQISVKRRDSNGDDAKSAWSTTAAGSAPRGTNAPRRSASVGRSGVSASHLGGRVSVGRTRTPDLVSVARTRTPDPTSRGSRR